MKAEDIKKKREMLVKQYNTLKDKIDEAKAAIMNMNAQLNGIAGAVQLCDDFLNNPEDPKKEKTELNQENIK
jgi:chromosome segregation ATPase